MLQVKEVLSKVNKGLSVELTSHLETINTFKKGEEYHIKVCGIDYRTTDKISYVKRLAGFIDRYQLAISYLRLFSPYN